MAGRTKQLSIQHVAPGKLRPAPYNPRKMSEEQRARLERGIKEFGLVDPIIARRDGLVIGGHQRLASAKALGLKAVPVVYLDDITDDRAAALNILLNNPSAQGEWEMGSLTDILSELDAHGFDATLTGFDEEELRKLLAPAGDLLTDPDDVPPLPASPITKLGDLITLGRHRLVCGDSTLATVVDLALQGATPALMVTDPPYGVEYDPKWRLEAGVNKAHQTRAEGVVTNDEKSDWTEAWALFRGAVAYVWHAGRHASTVQRSLEDAGFEMRSQIIWGKPSLVISRGHYHWQHEPCWYAVRKGATAGWIGDRKQSTLWDIQNMHRTQGNVDDGKTSHGTQKPVEAMRRPLQNHEGDVYDPFLGSGTTLIAAELMGRTCYGIEISPAYCDVIVTRWQNATGQKAVRS